MVTATATFNGTAGAAPFGFSGTFGLDAPWSSNPSGSSCCALNATQSISGGMSARFNDTSKNGGAWSTSSPVASTYFRGYFYLTAAPTAGIAVHSRAHFEWANWTRALITWDRRLAVSERADAYTQTGVGISDSTAADTVPLNEWFRVESHIYYSPGGTDNDTATAKMWKASGAGVHANGTPDASVTIAYEGGDSSGWTFGPNSYGTAERTFLQSSQFMYVDEFAISDAGWIGPIAEAAGTSFAGIIPI